MAWSVVSGIWRHCLTIVVLFFVFLSNISVQNGSHIVRNKQLPLSWHHLLSALICNDVLMTCLIMYFFMMIGMNCVHQWFPVYQHVSIKWKAHRYPRVTVWEQRLCYIKMKHLILRWRYAVNIAVNYVTRNETVVYLMRSFSWDVLLLCWHFMIC